MVKLDDARSRWVPEDDNGNLTRLRYTSYGGQALRTYDYRYDKNGMRDTMIDNDGVHAYAYDAIYQITQATHPTVQNPLEQFSYDSVGNRITDLTHSEYQFNELNQLLEDDSSKYIYDLDGNQTEKIDKATGDTTHFVYDIENKLVQVQKPGMLAQYTYDALGRRIGKHVNGLVKLYRYDRGNLILEMNGNDSMIANYTFGPTIDDPLCMRRNGNNYFYIKDGLGSVMAFTDDAGNVKHEFKYAAFGKIVDESGDTVDNPFTYTSRELDSETGNLYYCARYYYPQVGRFLNEDPLGLKVNDYNLYRRGLLRSDPYFQRYLSPQLRRLLTEDLIGFSADEFNYYLYVSNNPINGLDPFGLWYIDVNVSGGFIGGLTGGFMIGPSGFFPYVGGGLITPGIGGSITWSPSDPTSGCNIGFQGQAAVAGQVGYGFGPNGGPFWEVGGGWPPGASLMFFYVFGPFK